MKNNMRDQEDMKTPDKPGPLAHLGTTFLYGIFALLAGFALELLFRAVRRRLSKNKSSNQHEGSSEGEQPQMQPIFPPTSPTSITLLFLQLLLSIGVGMYILSQGPRHKSDADTMILTLLFFAPQAPFIDRFEQSLEDIQTKLLQKASK